MLGPTFRVVRWVAASLVLVPAVLWSGACVQVSGLGAITIVADGGGGGGASIVACTRDDQCDDGDPCTTDSCNAEGICVLTPVPDGTEAPSSAQTAGNCQKVVCTSGVTSSVDDDSNAPPAPDMCTSSSCAAGVPQMSSEPDGTPCAILGLPGECEGGKCLVACASSIDCTSTNPCQVGTCDGSTGMCTLTNVPDGTAAPGNTMGNCYQRICVAGMETNTIDNANLPAVVNDCGTPTCANGVPSQSYTLHPADSPCSTYMQNQPGFCDGMGNCIECTKDSECIGTGAGMVESPTDCDYSVCTNGTCVLTQPPSGTPTTVNPPQVVGNCQQLQCDGNGGTVTVTDDSNVPAPLGGGCQPGGCTNGEPSHSISSDGTPCGTSLACLSGECSGCTTNAQCQPPAYDTCGGGGTANACGCTPTTCAKLGATCGTPSDGCAEALSCNTGMVAGSETDVDCGGPVSACLTRCAQGKKCKVGSDCVSGFCADGVCCNIACTGLTCQACSAAAKGQGVDGVCGAVAAGASNDPHHDCSTQAVATCGESGGCNGAGACNTYANGTTCAAATCSGGTLTNPRSCASGVCTTPTPATTSCAPYLACGSAAACATSCTTDASCVSSDYCAAGACQPRKATGACTANDQCTSSNCGTTGTGSCCAGATCLTGTCGATSCNAASGACNYTASGTSCGTTCSGSMLTPSTCNGNGGCVAGTPAACPNNLACNALMAACLASCAGNDSNCASGYYCNSSNACVAKGGTGAACTASDQCTSGVCLTTLKCQ